MEGIDDEGRPRSSCPASPALGRCGVISRESPGPHWLQVGAGWGRLPCAGRVRLGSSWHSPLACPGVFSVYTARDVPPFDL